MPSRPEMQKLAEKYGRNVSVGILASHSAEDVGVAAKAAGIACIAVCEKGREELYTKYNKKLFSELIILEKFKDILKNEVQELLRKKHVVFLPNRAFSVYVGYDEIERDFCVPIYGNRRLLRIEDRKEEKGQYWLLRKAGVRTPKKFSSPKEIDRLVIVKVQQKSKPLERAFFYCKCEEEFYRAGEKLVAEDIISEEALMTAHIEEFVIGPRFNANFHVYGLSDGPTLDFVGFEDRIQTNLCGILNLPAQEQMKVNIPITNEEIGHFGVTMRESKKRLVYEAAERFVYAAKKEFPPGIIGLFSLQGAVAEGSKRELEFVVFDVSPRIPGCPCVGPTSPEMRRLSLIYGTHIESPLDITMIEIRRAAKEGNLGAVVT